MNEWFIHFTSTKAAGAILESFILTHDPLSSNTSIALSGRNRSDMYCSDNLTKKNKTITYNHIIYIEKIK